MSTETSSSDEELCPLEMVDVNTNTNVEGLLPEKSKSKYEKVYKDFMEWRTNKQLTTLSETVIVAYFEDLSTRFNPASLWTFYSMLKNMLLIKHDVDMGKYRILCALLKQKSEGYKAKKSKTFSSEEINKFLKEAPNQFYLQSKVGLIFGVMGGCRRQQLYNLKYKDVQVFDKTILVTVRNSKNKTARTFTVTGAHSELCKKYIKLRPKECTEKGFFLSYSNGKCNTQKVGINKFGSLGKTIAGYLELPDPEMYTGNCFRRTSETVLVEEGGHIKPRTKGRKSASATDADEAEDPIESNEKDIDENSIEINVKQEYIEDPNDSKDDVDQSITTIRDKEVVNVNINMPSTSNQNHGPNSSSTVLETGQLHIYNCTTVNVYHYYNK